ncbi:MAG TPA: ATP-binding protein [Candidatus Limnocylindrales bacterium]|jgi:nitrogen-specific signal transduction histidine kinase|nr:ATP-binding protein [Candidatus Limnocylindrales bacterium]
MKVDPGFGLENAGWPALLVDGASVICRANQAAIKVFGAALEGASPQLSSIWSPENGSSPEQFLAQWERAPAATVPLKFRAKGGTTLAHAVSICSFSREEGKYFLLQWTPGTAANSEDKSRGGETTFFQKQKLECALQMARSVALDFNNALTGILGHTSHVLSSMEPKHPWRDSLLEVEKAAAWAAEIANDLGAFSLQEKGARGQAPGNLNVVLQRAIEVFQRNKTIEGIDWKLLLEKSLFSTKFDEAKMQQAFIKIVENSVEALPDGGRITVQTHNVELAEVAQDRNVRLGPGAHVCVEISDNGKGIAPEVLPRIFEPFFTTKMRPHRGLGLAWVYGVITNHGGGVAVSSQPGAGTSVRVYLPAEDRIVQDQGGALEQLRGDQKILIVDDEDLLLTMGQTILSAYGYSVLTANSGPKALEILSGKESIDLVITDMVMPAMSGRELIEKIHESWPSIPILCTSGYVRPGGQETDTAYLQKPFTSRDLLIKVKQVLQL